ERWSAEQIQEEHQFAHDLLDDDVPVAAPLKFNNQTLLTHEGFYYAVFPSLGGRQFEADNIDQMEWVARYLGRIHQTGRKKAFIARPTIGIQEYLLEPREIFETSAMIPAALKDDFLNATDKLIAAVKTCWRDDISVLRLHGDCHAGNILWRDGPLFVDLDDARMGPAVPFNSDEIALIEPLRAMRFVYYLAWLIRRWDDPAFPRNFPWLTGEDYWRSQISTFTEQVKVLQEPPLQLTPMY
ncbi:MAG: serine/threonine protein kinase, partial [Enterobacter asburiae]|nr:serine/threonine protein kinase [Enterobacter asburiae]